MFFVSVMILMLVFTFSPFKLSLFLSLISVFLSGVCYMATGSVFVSSALVISFSSGMMILFSYCAMISNYQTKNKMLSFTLLVIFLFMLVGVLLFSVGVSDSLSIQSFTQNLTLESSSLIFLMFIVFFSMFNMNKTYFNPTKKFMQSYWCYLFIE